MGQKITDDDALRELDSIAGRTADKIDADRLYEARAHLAARVADLADRATRAEFDLVGANLKLKEALGVATSLMAERRIATATIAGAEAELSAVREALSFYANAANYYAQPGAGNAIRQDQGNLARAAFAGAPTFIPTYATDAARGAG